jgi:hypothetical protein
MKTYSILTTIPHGPKDLGAEIDVLVTFKTDMDIEFVSAEPYCNGNPRPFYGVFADLEQSWLDDLAEDWLEDVDLGVLLSHMVEVEHDAR